MKQHQAWMTVLAQFGLGLPHNSKLCRLPNARTGLVAVAGLLVLGVCPKAIAQTANQTTLLTLGRAATSSAGVAPWVNPSALDNPALRLAQAPILYVNPVQGQNTSGGGLSITSPLRTITYALQQARPGTTIQLAPGSYAQNNGEIFPLVLPAGVTLAGNPSNNGLGTLLIGGGAFSSPTFGPRNVTLLIQGNGAVRGVTVTNPNSGGVGIWVESASPTIANNTFIENLGSGVFVTGSSAPTIAGNVITNSGTSGVTFAGAAQGQLQNNEIRGNGAGVLVTSAAAPQISDNQISENREGVVVGSVATPVLRNNLIFQQRQDGLRVNDRAIPNLGTPSSPGRNQFRENQGFDVNNTTDRPIPAVGNSLNPNKIAGSVDLEGGSVPDTNLVDIQTHWARRYIEALASRQIVTGFPDNSFKPDSPMARVEFAALITKAFAPTPQRSPKSFSDVPPGYWGFAPIRTAQQGGFLSGYPDGSFRPNQQIPRLEALVAIASGLGLSTESLTILAVYQDAASIPIWARKMISASTQRRIVVNYPNPQLLDSQRSATRAEVAAFVHQALVSQNKLPPLQNPPFLVEPP